MKRFSFVLLALLCLVAVAPASTPTPLKTGDPIAAVPFGDSVGFYFVDGSILFVSNDDHESCSIYAQARPIDSGDDHVTSWTQDGVTHTVTTLAHVATVVDLAASEAADFISSLAATPNGGGGASYTATWTSENGTVHTVYTPKAKTDSLDRHIKEVKKLQKAFPPVKPTKPTTPKSP